MQACDGCRGRKIRCLQEPDGNACGRCRRLRISCTFDKPVKTRGPKKRAFTGGEIQVHDRSMSDDLRGYGGLAQGSPLSSFVNDAPVITAASSSPTQHSSLHTDPDFSSYDHQPDNTTISTTPSNTVDAYQQGSWPTDFICPRYLILQILEHYLLYLYPLIPVVHRPSFRRDIANARDVGDADFLGLEIAICAAVVGTMPSRFTAYRAEHSSYPFESRRQLLYCCYNKLIALREQDYFDTISYNKWAISYLIAVAFFQIGDHNRARMVDVESMQLGRLLHMHIATEYAGLDNIEIQLRKKGFWLLFYTYIHSRIQSLRKERLSYLDTETVQSIDPELLLPFDLDDEVIGEDDVLSTTPRGSCVTTGFITHSRVFWAAIQDPTPLPHPVLSAAAAQLEAKIDNLKYMLDDVLPELRPWVTHHGPELAEETAWQFGTMRANLHVTHLWLQSILTDQLEVMTSENKAYQRKLWQAREEIGRQLLHHLHSIPEAVIEPNGLHLAYKVRDVAVGLLSCPFESHEPASLRAAIYVREFTQILSRLDASGTVNTANLQSWVDTGRDKGPITPGRGAILRNENMAWP